MQIELPGGQIAEFPDDMPLEQIKSIVRAKFPPKSLLQRSAEDVQQHINQPIEALGRGARNIGIGFSQGLLNTAPNLYNLARMGTNALGAHLPESPTFNFAPNDINSKAGEIASYFAAPEALLNLGGKSASVLGNSLKAFTHNPKNLFTTKNSLKNDLLTKHDMLENRASDTFKNVSKQVNQRGINKIPIEQHLEPEFFENIKQYFPNTRSSSSLISKAETGDYNSLRKLQSDLYTRAKKNLGSDLEADRLRGSEMLEKREDVNQAISNHLRNTKNLDLDKALDTAREDWRTLQNTYYNDNISNSLVKMFNKDIRKIPDNLINLLSEESLPMKNLKDFHPGIDDKLAAYKFTQSLLNKGKKVGVPLAVGALGGYEFGKK